MQQKYTEDKTFDLNNLPVKGEKDIKSKKI
jgi:hypothetical protein